MIILILLLLGYLQFWLGYTLGKLNYSKPSFYIDILIPFFGSPAVLLIFAILWKIFK